MAITRVSASNLSGTSLPSTITTASGLSLGKVLQVVQTIDKNQGSFSLATDTISTMMTVNITPSSTSSKILVRFDAYFGNQSTPAHPYVILRRDGSDIYRANTAGSRKNSTGYTGNMGNENLQCLSNEFLDSPSSTSQLAYTLNVAGFASRTFYKNIPDVNSAATCTACSSITVMELAT